MIGYSGAGRVGPGRPAAIPVPDLAKASISMLEHGLNLSPRHPMTAPLKAIDGNADLPVLMTELAARARGAARVLALASPEQKNKALDAIARAIRANTPAILAANAEDVTE